MTTRLGLPALWWYGAMSISEPASNAPEGAGSILEVGYIPGRRDCPDGLRVALSGRQRVLLHLGFRFDDVPRGFDDLLFDGLAGVGQVIGYRRFAESTYVAVIDLRQPSTTGPRVAGRPDGPPPDMVPRPRGCLRVEPAQRW